MRVVLIVVLMEIVMRERRGRSNEFVGRGIEFGLQPGLIPELRGAELGVVENEDGVGQVVNQRRQSKDGAGSVVVTAGSTRERDHPAGFLLRTAQDVEHRFFPRVVNETYLNHMSGREGGFDVGAAAFFVLQGAVHEQVGCAEHVGVA